MINNLDKQIFNNVMYYTKARLFEKKKNFKF